MRNPLKITSLLLLFFIVGCSKEDGNPDDSNANRNPGLSGELYFDWATEGTLRIDAKTGVKHEFLSSDTKRNGWSVSHDKQLLLTASSLDIWSDDITFVLNDIKDNRIISEFNYSPVNGGSGYNSGELSHDNSLIAIDPSFEEGVVIISTSGKLVAHIFDVNGEKIGKNEEVRWLPNNSLLITHKRYIIKWDPPYNSGTLIKEINYEDWGDLAVDPSGKKIAVRIDNHIHMMNFDGSNMTQVTKGDSREVKPEFSPDGSHILVGADYRKTGPFGAIWDLKIIPADGKSHDVNGKNAIAIISNGETSPQAGSGKMVWR